ncbi:ribosomal large subunit 23S rRNA methyltransferase SpoU [Gluconacetobacter johannae DSM 13595]|uniref:RNA methyltransferase n=1 Tax=Gluconacetobacter johannae TaxID=112140 RepID=A0A7W4J7J5_9PROT|nr:RNA methyltransferase [Gluconacetobacter johannae]MBB2176180.1 RNA methyltransferase [Gluconacetobacter johannae]GBQ89268.1 ribosomal large subunit 23S rRNA methyltransferase SpoU [Gluconacetobacter johannae DSM 13595]
MRNRPPRRPDARTAQRPSGRTDPQAPSDTARPSRQRGAASPRGTPPRGTYWLYGLHPALAALANPERRIRQILTTEEGEAALRERLGAPLPMQPHRTDRSRLDALCGRDAVHQGIAVLTDALPSLAVDDVIDRPGPVLLLDQVTDPRNVGAILRSAAAFRAAAVVVMERNAPDETGALAKAASGALEIVPLLRVVNLARTLDALKDRGFWVVGLDAGGGVLDGTSFGKRRVALVLGAEGDGLRRLTREHCDEISGLAMPGDMESLNVSNAAAVALYELARAGVS